MKTLQDFVTRQHIGKQLPTYSPHSIITITTKKCSKLVRHSFTTSCNMGWLESTTWEFHLNSFYPNTSLIPYHACTCIIRHDNSIACIQWESGGWDLSMLRIAFTINTLALIGKWMSHICSFLSGVQAMYGREPIPGPMKWVLYYSMEAT